MKLIRERLISRSKIEQLPDYAKPVLVVNLGLERRYRKTGDFFGFLIKKKLSGKKKIKFLFLSNKKAALPGGSFNYRRLRWISLIIYRISRPRAKQP